jgi:hypothetical protein
MLQKPDLPLQRALLPCVREPSFGTAMIIASTKPQEVVQKQLDAYNARDIEALLSIYADDAQMFEHPSKLVASGSAELSERFAARFKEPDLYAALRQRIVVGQVVIDHEDVTRNFPEGKGTIELVMIYEVQKGRISKAWMISGAKTLDPK